MQYEERISTSQGNYIVASGVDFEDILIKEPIRLITGEINPGEQTTLHGWFTKPMRFCGFLADEKINTKQAIFYIGGNCGDLFINAPQYYDCTFILAPDHIGKSYKRGTFRDCYLRQKGDSFFWK